MFPFELFLEKTCKLFIKAFRRQVLPLPTSPIIPICSPFNILTFISFNKIIFSIFVSLFLIVYLFSLLVILFEFFWIKSLFNSVDRIKLS